MAATQASFQSDKTFLEIKNAFLAKKQVIFKYNNQIIGKLREINIDIYYENSIFIACYLNNGKCLNSNSAFSNDLNYHSIAQAKMSANNLWALTDYSR